jgi:hypothetical protein
MKKILFVLFISTPILAKPICSKTLITANMTDMRDELKKYKKEGWKPVGRIQFRDYSFQLKLRKKCG